MKILTISYGGMWTSDCEYVGDISSKAVLLNADISLEELKSTINQRCDILSPAKNMMLSHLHPFQKLKNPFKVENEEDLSSFLHINAAPGVDWKMPLYVSFNENKVMPLYVSSLNCH